MRIKSIQEKIFNQDLRGPGLWILLAIHFFQGLLGIYNYGYVGQDYDYHIEKMFRWIGDFSYQGTNPPGYYVLSYGVVRIFGSLYSREMMAGVTLLLNMGALYGIAGFIQKNIRSLGLQWSALLVIIFVPFRVIHSIVFSADALTVPLFFLLLHYGQKLLENGREEAHQSSPFQAWMSAGVSLLVAQYCKYTFIACVPVFGLILWRQWEKKETRKVAILAVTLPLLLFVYQLGQSARAKSLAIAHYRGEESQMTLSDLFIPKLSDLDLLKAPYYFTGGVNRAHQYSYPSLLHMSAFSDPMHFWQTPPPHISRDFKHRVTENFARDISPFHLRINQWSIFFSLPLSLMALGGFLLGGIQAVRYWQGRASADSGFIALLTTLALGPYFAIFVSLPFFAHAYSWGYWLPRLVMPSLISFMLLGFIGFDRVLVGKLPRFVPVLVLAYASFLSAIFLLSLV